MKTAVEFLIEEMGGEPKTQRQWDKVIEQAKEMEKKQIKDAYISGFKTSGEGYNGEYPFEGRTISNIGEEIYYNETFKQ